MTDCAVLQPPKRPRLPSSGSDEEEEPAAQRYPPEIWEAIFRHLTGLQLLRMRLVCRRWRDIITACPPLMAQFKIVVENFDLRNADGDRLSNDESIDRDFRASGLLPVTLLEFRDYCLHETDFWWPCFGHKLTHISMLRCDLDFAFLFSALRHAPNLRSLHLREMLLIDSAECNFRLDKMEELSLKDIFYHSEGELMDLLDVLAEIFPRLKRLRIRKIAHLNVDGLLRSIRALRDTLEGFELDDPVAVDVIRDLPQQRMKGVSIHVGTGFVWQSMARFFRDQPLIEELVIYAKDLLYEELLCDIGRAVPKLKRLTLRDINDMFVDFLEFMPNLETLKICCAELNTSVNMDSKGSPRLKELYIRNAFIPGFMEYLRRSPQIRSVIMHESYFEETQETPSKTRFNNHVRFLKVSDWGGISLEMLEMLYQQCPMIEHVFLGFDENLDKHINDEVLVTCERLKFLRKLTLECCIVSDSCIEHVINHGHLLEELKIIRFSVSEVAIEKLKSTTNIRVTISND